MRRVLVLAIVVAALALVGCGGASSGSTTSTGVTQQPGPSPSAAANAGPPSIIHVNLPPGDRGGKLVVAQSGCLACHRIDHTGDGRLGPHLTHIGATMSRRSILRTLKAGPGIMPSFQNLGQEKLNRAASYLADLK
jgi:mono/diheme cytochrome c family protein